MQKQSMQEDATSQDVPKSTSQSNAHVLGGVWGMPRHSYMQLIKAALSLYQP